MIPTIFFQAYSSAQELQRNAYTFLNVPAYARLGGMGGVNVSLIDRDLNSFLSNPSLAGDTLRGLASASYQFYVADIGNAAFAYMADLPKVGAMSFGVQHFSYGNIAGYDASGNDMGEFSAAETALIISKNHQVGNFRFGLSIKPVFSSLAGFRSTAILMDAGGVFIHPEKEFAVGLAFKNAGYVLKDYSETSDSKVPMDVQIGTTFKPEHMPLRFSLTVYRLIQSEPVSYNGVDLTDPRMLDKVLRHFNFATEILFHRNVNLLLGYNYGLHQELKLTNAGGSAGISFGFSARIKSFEFVFSRSTYVAQSAGYSFTLSADVRKMMKKE